MIGSTSSAVPKVWSYLLTPRASSRIEYQRGTARRSGASEGAAVASVEAEQVLQLVHCRHVFGIRGVDEDAHDDPRAVGPG